MQILFESSKIAAEYTAHSCREKGMRNVAVSRTTHAERAMSWCAYKVTFENPLSAECSTCGDNPSVECSACGSTVAGGLFGAGIVQQTLTLF